MKRLKLVILIEFLIIITLAIFLIWHPFSTGDSVKTPSLYCNKYFYQPGICLLSPSIDSGDVQPKNYFIFNFNSLKESIQNYINQNNLDVSVYTLDIESGASFGINSSKNYFSASLNKLPIAILILKKVEDKKLSLDTMLPIKEGDRDSSDGTLYATNETEMSVRDLLSYMLSKSDNTALRVLEEQLTIQDLEYLSSYLNYYSQDVNKIYSDNLPTELSSKSTANIFLSLYSSTILNPDDSQRILTLLTNTTFDINNYASIPKSTIVSQKYGAYYTLTNSTNVFHDCGIIYFPEERILYCIMSQGITNEEDARNIIGGIVGSIYNYVLGGQQIDNFPLQ